jgi:hypothetical protein
VSHTDSSLDPVRSLTADLTSLINLKPFGILGVELVSSLASRNLSEISDDGSNRMSPLYPKKENIDKRPRPNNSQEQATHVFVLSALPANGYLVSGVGSGNLGGWDSILAAVHVGIRGTRDGESSTDFANGARGVLATEWEGTSKAFAIDSDI